MARAEFNGLMFQVPDGVYQPAEDSFLLAEFSEKLSGEVLDMGCGCGIQAIAARNSKALGVDINEAAVLCATENAKINKSPARFLVSDMFSALGKDEFNAIVFNPPYLPTSDSERLGDSENLAYDGGADGRVVLDRFLSDFKAHLKPKGRVLLLLSSLSDKGETEERLRNSGFEVRELARKHVGLMEELFVLEGKGRN